MQKLLVLQSLWSMQRLHTDGREHSLETSVEMIANAGFDGLGSLWTDRDMARRVSELARSQDLAIEGLCFPRSVDDLQPALDLGAAFGLHHLNIQPDLRLRTVAECLPILHGWQRLAQQADFGLCRNPPRPHDQ